MFKIFTLLVYCVSIRTLFNWHLIQGKAWAHGIFFVLKVLVDKKKYTTGQIKI